MNREETRSGGSESLGNGFGANGTSRLVWIVAAGIVAALASGAISSLVTNAMTHSALEARLADLDVKYTKLAQENAGRIYANGQRLERLETGDERLIEKIDRLSERMAAVESYVYPASRSWSSRHKDEPGR